MVEQRKKLELKKLRKRLKKAKGGEKKNIEEKIQRIESRKEEVEEQNFEIIVNTLANKRRAQEKLKKKRREEEQVRQEMVRKGLIEDRVYLNSRKYKVDGHELQDFCLSKAAFLLTQRPEEPREHSTSGEPHGGPDPAEVRDHFQTGTGRVHSARAQEEEKAVQAAQGTHQKARLGQPGCRQKHVHQVGQGPKRRRAQVRRLRRRLGS